MMKQAKALAVLKSGKNVFLTGSAGAGKTYVLNQYIEYLKASSVPVAVTASTGIAATHMNGMTIHAWSGIGVKEALGPAELLAMQDRKYLRDKLEQAQVLIIDEISMLHKQQVDLVDLVLKHFKGNTLPFGGIQVVFSGDFFQLPPVGKPMEEPRDKFAFMSKAWLEAEPCICYLSEQFRQSDNSLNDLLNRIREARIGPEEIAMLESARRYTAEDGEKQTSLFTHNVDVDRMNRDYLYRLETEKKIFKAELKGNETLREILKKSVLTDEVLELRTGARVMFVKNNYEKGYMNGSIGEISGFSEEGHPVVSMKNGSKIVAEPEDWSIQDDQGKSLASFRQVPLRLAWAITIHKSQGMTLDQASIDLSKTFEKGQGYVALSRLKDMESLCLKGFNSLALEVDPLALKADQRFRQLSQQADARWSIEELEKRFDLFVEACGGIPASKASLRGKKKKSIKKKSESTYEKTAALIRQGKNLQEICEIRGLSRSSIVAHIEKIRKEMPGLDLHGFRPSEEKLRLLQSALDEYMLKHAVRPDKLGPLYDILQGSLEYDEIRLGLIFTEEYS